ncbi:MAG TPA: AMP-binding protein [Clostridia bacterium]|nr:AMP-binding protein [Clostridia bacterium]
MFYSRFVESVGRWPDVIAVEIQRQQGSESVQGSSVFSSQGTDEAFTYAQLRTMAESIARWLLENGISGGARCAILAGNSPRWVAAYLGIVASGNTAVPLDTAFRPDQVARLLEDSGATLLFADSRHLALARASVAASKVRLALIEPEHPGTSGLPTLDLMFAEGPGSFTPPQVAPDDIACILYTSGTTSDPKGVILTHANLAGEIESVRRYLHLGPSDALLGVLPLFHALAQMANIMLPFANGARVVFLDSLNTAELLRALQERGITIFCCVPQFFYLIHERIFTKARERGRFAWNAFQVMLKLSRIARALHVNLGKTLFRPVHALLGPKMRYFVTGGSRFDPAIGRDLYNLGFEVLQAYGLTETSGGAFATPPDDNVMGSIGRPLPGNEARIADPKPAEEATHGYLVGEIAIRGPIVMKGYYNRPDATAEVLRDGWLHTGDLAYADKDGNYFITGRAKEVIVLSNGKNIYPEEIENYYLKSPWIKEICVVGIESRPGEPMSERLHGVVVPNFDLLRQKKIVNTREVIRYDIEGISSHLAPTKRILSYEIWQDDLPRTTTRKLKRFEIERRVRENQARPADTSELSLARQLTDEEREWLALPDVRRSIEIIRNSSKNKTTALHPSDNLELDLGLDSMERVELLVSLEHHLGANVDDSLASEVYTVRELVDAVRQSAGSVTGQGVGWETLLQTEVTDPEVLAISKPRPIITAFWYIFGRFVSLFVRDVFRLRVEGTEKIPANAPFIISPNHQSFLDAAILTAVLPWHAFREVFYVGTSEIFGSGIWRQFARFLRLIPVDPDANLVPAMRAGAYGLRKGRVLMLFPEGERSIDGPPKPFKKGAAILAYHLNVPVVPVALEGFYEAWPRGKQFQRFTDLKIRFGDPIYPDPNEAPELAYDRLTTELHDRVDGMWEELRNESEATHDPAATPAPR